MTARRLHLYLGVFFAPLIIFFAFSGVLQTFGLHESKVRGEPPPTSWIAFIAEIHKDQRLRNASQLPPSPPPSAERSTPTKPPADRVPPKPAFLLKIFVAAMSIGLMFSVLLGIYIALTNPKTRKITLICLVLGCALPPTLLLV